MRSFDIGTDHLSEPAVSPSHSDDRTFTLREVEVFIEDMRRKITADVHRLIVEGVESFRKEFDSKLAQLEMEQKEFRRILGAHAVLDKGQFPHPATISKIGCQVWHSPDLTPIERRTKSPWSLRFTIFMHGERVKEEINIRLYPFDKFAKIAKRHPTDKVIDLVEQIDRTGSGDRAWGGLVQGYTHGAGRPYVGAQAAFLVDHERDTSPEADKAFICLVIGDTMLYFGPHRPAAGGKKSALWYSEWQPKQA